MSGSFKQFKQSHTDSDINSLCQMLGNQDILMTSGLPERKRAVNLKRAVNWKRAVLKEIKPKPSQTEYRQS